MRINSVNKIFIICLNMLLMLCWTLTAHAQEAILLDHTQHKYVLDGKLDAYRETEAQLTIEELIKKTERTDFYVLNTVAPAFAQSEDALWFRGKLRNSDSESLQINWVINYIFIEQIDFYQISNQKIIKHNRLGKRYSYNDREVDVEPYVFPARLEKGEESEFYFRIKSNYPLLVPFTLVDERGLAEQQRSFNAFVGMYFGVMVGMIFYNLFLYVSIRDIAYLYYVFFICSVTGTQLSLIGALDQFTPDWVSLNLMMGNLMSSLAITGGLLFARKMLEVEQFHKVIRRILNGTLIFFALCIAGSLLSIPNIHIPLTAGVAGASLLIFALAIKKVWLGYQPARYFLLAWTVFTIGAVTGSSLYTGLVTYSAMKVWIMPLCSSIEATLLSFTLAARISLLRKQQHEAELTAQKALTENESRGQFLANMSHEIRTPLTAVIGYAETLRRDAVSDEERNHCADVVIRSGKHLLSVVNNILDLSKLDADKIEFEEMAIPLPDLIEELKSQVGFKANEKGLEFIVELDFPLPASFFSDPTRLKQILFNLANNAIKFTPQGKVSLEISYKRSSQIIRFSLADTGIGMTPEQLGKVFKAFVQADNSTTRVYGGTGLGLSISKQLAQKLGGDLVAESEYGKGSVFHLSLPAVLQSTPSWLQSTRDCLVKNFTLESTQRQNIPILCGHVLVADDNEDNQGLIKHLFALAGVTVTVVSNGLQALEKTSDHTFDLILLDMQMPVMGGQEALKELRARGNKTPVLAFTANVMRHQVAEYLSSGFEGCIGKPIERATFYSEISLHLKPHEKNSSWGEIQGAYTGFALTGMALVAEPLIDDQEYLKETLESLGITVVIANNGQELVEKSLADNIRLILFNPDLQIMDGLAAVTLLRQAGCDTPAYMLADAQHPDLLTQNSDKELVSGILLKPIPKPDLLAVLAPYMKLQQEESGTGKEIDPEFLLLKQRFLQRLPEMLTTMKSHLESGEWSELQSLAHQLKGTGGSFGYPRISDLSKTLSDELKHGRHECVATILATIREYVVQVT